MNSTYQDDVDVFMEAADQRVQMRIAYGFDNTDDQNRLYMDLIEEEFNETKEAFANCDLVEVADGLADMVWVIMGLASSIGIPFDEVWQEVRRSNMSKCVGGKVIKNEAGKVMKPDSYFRPDIKSLLEMYRGDHG